MKEIGELLGILIIIFYSLAVLNFCFKFINCKYKNTLKKKEGFYKIYMMVLKFLMKYHRYFGLATIVLLLAHFFVQFNQHGFNLTGGIAAGMMLLQVILGVYGLYKKNKNKNWLIVHRIIALLVLVAILIHVL